MLQERNKKYAKLLLGIDLPEDYDCLSIPIHKEAEKRGIDYHTYITSKSLGYVSKKEEKLAAKKPSFGRKLIKKLQWSIWYHEKDGGEAPKYLHRSLAELTSKTSDKWYKNGI